MLDKLLKLRCIEIRKSINDQISLKEKLITLLKASIIAIVFTSVIHTVLINTIIILYLYKSILLLINLFLLTFVLFMTVAYIEDIYYDLIKRKGYISNDIDLRELRINGFIHSSIIGACFSFLVSIITYLIIIII